MSQSIEEAKRALRANEEKIQNEFIDRLVDQVEFLAEKAVRKSYEPTDHEREQFAKIHAIITDMNLWF